ncbi:MAG: alpha/beta hydrolase family protein [Xanthobacteraceae bacterium]
MAGANQTTDITITARDGYALAATLFAPAEPKAAVLINSAAAVPRKIYRGLAEYLTERGFAVLTYDYRGIGGSRPASLRGFRGRMRDWATLDVAAAVDHARMRPRMPLTYIGHSFGGQALGLIPNNTEVARALIVASQAGTWTLIQSPERYRVLALMTLIGPPIAHVMGYVPGKVGLGEDMPRDVFLEWAGWVRSRRYFFDDTTLAELKNFPQYRKTLRAVGIDDDPWATPPAIDLLASGYINARLERVQIALSDVGAKRIGHFGFFRPDYRDTLWRDAADWLEKV